MKLKICGMKYQDNIKAVAALQPAYLGFIFYAPSPRNFDGEIPQVPTAIKKVGVFVDATIDFVMEQVNRFDFEAVQLHGKETPEYCKVLQHRVTNVEIWKVFSVKDTFNFNTLTPYENYVDYFLFDTKGKAKGGNGYTFDWSVLNTYTSKVPFILSGGIGLEEVPKVKEIIKTGLPVHAIDVNSRFETSPGLKDIERLKQLKKMLNNA